MDAEMFGMASTAGNGLMGPGAAGGQTYGKEYERDQQSMPSSTMQQGGLTMMAANKQIDDILRQLSGEDKAAMFEQAKSNIKGNPDICKQIVPQGSYSGSIGTGGKLEFFYIRSKDFGILKNADDKYNIFDKIKKSLFSELKDILHEDGLIKGMKVGYQSNKERLRKYYYLFHNVLSDTEPVTALQYACMWNRDDMVILILSYLVGSSKDYVKKYINYAVKSGEHQGKRAIDLISIYANQSLGMRSTASQGLSALSQVGKAAFNPLGYAAKAFGKTAKAVGQVANQATNMVGVEHNIAQLLLEFGSKAAGDRSGVEEDMNVSIKEVRKEEQNTQADPYASFGGGPIYSPTFEKMIRTRKFRRGKKHRGKTARR